MVEIDETELEILKAKAAISDGLDMIRAIENSLRQYRATIERLSRPKRDADTSKEVKKK